MNILEHKMLQFFALICLLLTFLLPYNTWALAPNFFATTPKNIPSIGKRGKLRLHNYAAEHREVEMENIVATLQEVLPYIDRDNNGELSVEELVHIPIVRKALESDWKEAFIPEDSYKVNSAFLQLDR